MKKHDRPHIEKHEGRWLVSCEKTQWWSQISEAGVDRTSWKNMAAVAFATRLNRLKGLHLWGRPPVETT